MEALSQEPPRAGSLARVKAVLKRLGHPEEGFPAIYVTGSHGKSSVIAFLEGAFAAAGLRVGAFVPSAPVPEMVRLSAEPVSPETLEPYLQRVEEAADIPLRAVEKYAAAAFLLFAAAGVEIALVGAEVGGRGELAHSLPRKLLTLVTGVEEDRVDIFGRGWERVLWEEAWAASPGVPLLTVERKVEALAAFAEGTKRAGGALVILDPDEVRPQDVSWEGVRWGFQEDPLGLGMLSTAPLGLYQHANLALAIGALCELAGGLELSLEAIRRGMEAVRLPGRFEVISRGPYVVLDAARNAAAAAALRRSLAAVPDPGGRRVLLFSIGRGQPVRATVEALFPGFSEVVLCSGGQGTIPPRALLPQARRLGVRCRIAGDPVAAAEEVLAELGADGLLVVVGPKEALVEVRGAIGRPA